MVCDAMEIPCIVVVVVRERMDQSTSRPLCHRKLKKAEVSENRVKTLQTSTHVRGYTRPYVGAAVLVELRDVIQRAALVAPVAVGSRLLGRGHQLHHLLHERRAFGLEPGFADGLQLARRDLTMESSQAIVREGGRVKRREKEIKLGRPRTRSSKVSICAYYRVRFHQEYEKRPSK